MDFNDFDRDEPNFKMSIGGLLNETSSFQGSISDALQTVQVGAEYMMIFSFLFVGTLCYCALWVGGQWIVASESAEINNEVAAILTSLCLIISLS